MKPVISTVAAVLGVMFSASLVLANPALLPKHPGYPAKPATSPVNGQPLANDPGQTNLGGDKALVESIAASDNHVQQNLQDANNERITKKQGAGQLPTVQGPQIKIEPPVKEATRMK
jgi:hypothetical protein